MNEMIAFHKSVRGYNHIQWGKLCEDASGSYCDPSLHYYVAAVADGHGSDQCFRANVGSAAAVDIAMDCLKEFAEGMSRTVEIEDRFYEDMLSNPRYQKMTIRRLTDTIHSRWYSYVTEDYKNTPETADEIALLDGKTSFSETPEKIYGTTLMAALWMKKCLILIHQGDGRCDVFYADGTVDQPIPWDKRCVGTQTTSLCDSDVEPSFRSCVIGFDSNPVIACYLGCDGVEDAYRDSEETMEGVHTFYKGLTYEIANRDEDGLETYLTEMLPRFSAYGLYNNAGSGDDVSVAGIVDTDGIKPFVDAFHHDTVIYTQKEEVFWKGDAVRSKIRKHGILKRRLAEEQEKIGKTTQTIVELQEKIQTLSENIESERLEYQRILSEEEDFRAKAATVNNAEDCAENEALGLLKRFPDLFSAALDRINLEGQSLEKKRLNQKRKIQDLESRLSNMQAELQTKQADLDNLQKSLDEAKANFDSYDAKYKEAEKQYEDAQQALSSLLGEE